MKSFKTLLQEQALPSITTPSVSVSYQGHSLSLLISKKDEVLEASYEGPRDLWLRSLCELIKGKSLSTLRSMNLKSWEDSFREDQVFWELWPLAQKEVFFVPLELLKAAIDKFVDREYLYQEASPLVCRCFGIRESEITDYLKTTEQPTVAELGIKTKAGMGCRTCTHELERWVNTKTKTVRYYKDLPFADWLIVADEKLGSIPQASDWNMKVESFNGKAFIISYDKDVTQREEELMGKELQGFLGSAVDTGLAFFLRRSRQR